MLLRLGGGRISRMVELNEESSNLLIGILAEWNTALQRCERRILSERSQ